MGQWLRTTLDRLHSEYAPEKPLDSTRELQVFNLGTLVYARNYSGNPLWLQGKIVEITGHSYNVKLSTGHSYFYKVKLEDGKLWRRHIDQGQGQGSVMVHQLLDWAQSGKPPNSTPAGATNTSCLVIAAIVRNKSC